MEVESSQYLFSKPFKKYHFLSNGTQNDDDIENIEKLAEGLTSSHNGTNHNEKERKKKFSKKTNRFHELNYFLNTIPSSDTKKMTRDEKKAADYQRMFDKMEEKSNKKKKNYKNERKKIKTGPDLESGLSDIKVKIDLEESSHEEEKIKESTSNAEAKSSKTLSKSQCDTTIPSLPPPKIKQPDTQINPSFNLEAYDNLFYYLYYYVKSERKSIEEMKEKEYNGEQVSSFKGGQGKPKEENGRRVVKVDETVFQKTKFIQDSVRRKFKENMEKMNCTAEKDLLVREFSRKHINKEEIKNLLETEFSYY